MVPAGERENSPAGTMTITTIWEGWMYCDLPGECRAGLTACKQIKALATFRAQAVLEAL